jgi:hypothetical protein
VVVAGILFAYTGMTLLSLAMARHFRQVWHRELSPHHARWLRTSGWAFIGVSLFACMADSSWSLGMVAWCGALTAAAIALIFLLPYRPKAAVALAGVTPLAATVLLGVV